MMPKPLENKGKPPSLAVPKSASSGTRTRKPKRLILSQLRIPISPTGHFETIITFLTDNILYEFFVYLILVHHFELVLHINQSIVSNKKVQLLIMILYYVVIVTI